MSNEEIKAIYLSAQKAIAALSTPYGAELKESKELYNIALQIVEKYANKYYEVLIEENPDAKQLVSETNEAIEVLQLISPTSYLAVKDLNKLITDNSEKVQNELSFDEGYFYDKYFLTLPVGEKEEINPDITENERFNEWFGNSKVVDENKKPLIVYHGSGGKIDEFTSFKFSPFPGNYFAENKKYSEFFAKYRGGNSFLFKCYLRVQNPIDLTPFHLEKVNYEDFVTYIKIKYGYDLPENKTLRAMSDSMKGMWAWRYLRNGVDWLKYIASQKEFDGFYYYENNPDDQVGGKENVTKAWMVLHPEQIKTADMRNSTYSLFTNDTRMKKGGLL